MTDFYSVLQRAVASLPEATGPQRRAVYDKARKALLKQLQSFDPPLPSADVTAQRLALEDAIRKLEADIVRNARTKRAVESALPRGAGGEAARGERKPAAGGDAAAPPDRQRSRERPVEGEPAPSRARADDRGDETPEPARRPGRRERAAPAEDTEAARVAPQSLEAALASERATAAEPPGEPEPEPEPAPEPPPEEAPEAPREPDAFAPPPDEEPASERAARRRGFFSRGRDGEARRPRRGKDAPEEDPGDAAPTVAEERAPADRRRGRNRRKQRKEPAPGRRAAPPPAPAPEEAPRGRFADEDALPPEAFPEEEEERPAARTGGDALVPAGPRRNALGEPDEVGPGGFGGFAPGEYAGERIGARHARNHNRRVAKVLLTLAILVVVAGIGAAGYLYRDTIMQTVAGLTGDDAGRTEPVTSGGQQAGVPKDDARLGGPPPEEDEEVRRVRTTRITTPGAEDRAETEAETAPDAAAEEEAPADGAAAPGDGTPAPDEAPEADRTAAEADADAVREAAPEAPDLPAGAGEQAVLYEEAAQIGERGAAAAGEVDWTFTDRSVGGGPEEPVIEAVARIPERDIVASILMRENDDDALPASHLIEISFELPDDFPGGGIANVPGLILKESEQARGNALRGAAARVSSNLFWIALSDAEGERDFNAELLRDRGWIDLPILYENGRRAILTLQKGAAGDEAIEAAFEAWNGG